MHWDKYHALANLRWNFHTAYGSKVQLLLPEFSDQKLILWSVYINSSSTDFNYDKIIGQNLLKKREVL